MMLQFEMLIVALTQNRYLRTQSNGGFYAAKGSRSLHTLAKAWIVILTRM